MNFLIGKREDAGSGSPTAYAVWGLIGVIPIHFRRYRWTCLGMREEYIKFKADGIKSHVVEGHMCFEWLGRPVREMKYLFIVSTNPGKTNDLIFLRTFHKQKVISSIWRPT